MYCDVIKPILDFSLACIFLPIFMLLYFVLYILNGGNPIFTQRRIGLNNKVFKIYKFNTMDHFQTEGLQKVTKMGKWLRSTSIDEIPQIVNVIKGEMSFVGPRPLLVEYLSLYSKEQLQRHSVKPGISGWAQINGRNTINWSDKFSLDLYYVSNLSLWLDVKIISHTIWQLLLHTNNEKEVFEKFNGNN